MRRVRGRARRAGLTPDDLRQIGWLAALQAAPRARAEARPVAFLGLRALGAMRDELRRLLGRYGPRPGTVPIEEWDEQPRDPCPSFDCERLAMALRRLPRTWRRAMIRRLAGQTTAEAAAAERTTPEDIATRVYRARMRLASVVLGEKS